MIEELKELSKRSIEYCGVVKGEQQTKNVLIEPFLLLLGFDVKNPFDIVTEYTCDFGTKKGEKVDYALMNGEEVIMLVEAKDCKYSLSKSNISQLYRYYSVSSARLAILTNGVEFMFFTDTFKQNTMDSEPFYTFNINNVTENDAEVLSMFKKGNISYDNIKLQAIKSEFSKTIKDYFMQQAINPSNDFISFMTKSLGFKHISSTDISILISNELKLMLGVNNTTVELKEIKLKSEIEDADDSNKEKLTGLICLSDLNLNNVKGTKPASLRINGENLKVTSWSESLVVCLNYLLSNGVPISTLDFLDKTTSKDSGWIRQSKDGMRKPKQLDTSLYDMYVDLHGSSGLILGRLKTALNETGYNLELVKVELV